MSNDNRTGLFGSLLCSCLSRRNDDLDVNGRSSARSTWSYYFPRKPNVTECQPHTLGFKFEDSIFSYELIGNWDPECLKVQHAMWDQVKGNPYKTNHNVESIRKLMSAEVSFLNEDTQPLYKKYINNIDDYEVHFDASQFDAGFTRDIRIKIFQPKSLQLTNMQMPAFIHFHSGAVCGLSIDDQYMKPNMARYSLECNVKVFTVEYRQAPETQAPGNIMDCYAAIKYIIENADKFNIDKSKIVIGGSSDGAYLAVGVAMELAKRGESNLVRMVNVVSPTSSNIFHKMKFEEMNEIEKRSYEVLKGFSSCIATGKWDVNNHEEYLEDPYVFPNEMSDEIMEFCPPMVVFTSEFDVARIHAEELAQRLEKNGVLLDYCCHPGTTHCWFTNFNNKMTDNFWADQAKAFRKFLL